MVGAINHLALGEENMQSKLQEMFINVHFSCVCSFFSCLETLAESSLHFLLKTTEKDTGNTCVLLSP